MAQTRLKQLREEAVLTVHELAEASGVSDDTISKIENEQRVARPSTLRKLAHALDVSPQELRRPAKVEEPVLLGEASREAGLTADPHAWAREHSARLHAMSDAEWATHVRELESVDEIEQEFQELVDEAKGLHAAHGGGRWLRPENRGQRIARTRKLREIRADRLADLASAAAKKRDEALTRRVMEALLEEAHS
jgi:transcriptional regulator with XRE-family HTH domain